MFVPVVDLSQHPLMPTTPSRARRWIKCGKATAFWKGGIFCVRLNAEPSARVVQPVACGIDPGSQREGYSILSAAHTYLNIQAEAREGVKEAERISTRMRRTRRGRKTPCRKPRQNRKQSKKKLPPSTRARGPWKLRLARFLGQIFPAGVYVVEDIAAATKQGNRRWNRSFSPLEVGKHWFYEQIKRLAPLQILQGYETKALREQLGLQKTSKKLAEDWEAHCVDAWVLAHSVVGGKAAPDNKRLVIHPTWGKATVGGTMDGKLSLHDPSTNRRLTQSAKVWDCRPLKLLRWRTRLVPLTSSAANKKSCFPPDAFAKGSPVAEDR